MLLGGCVMVIVVTEKYKQRASVFADIDKYEQQTSYGNRRFFSVFGVEKVFIFASL